MAGGVALLCFAEVKELADFCLIHPKSQKREKKPGQGVWLLGAVWEPVALLPP